MLWIWKPEEQRTTHPADEEGATVTDNTKPEVHAKSIAVGTVRNAHHHDHIAQARQNDTACRIVLGRQAPCRIPWVYPMARLNTDTGKP